MHMDYDIKIQGQGGDSFAPPWLYYTYSYGELRYEWQALEQGRKGSILYEY